MKLIVGLGNPGTRYAATRHNVGFRVVDGFAAQWGIDLGREKFHAWFGKGEVGEEPVVLLKPTTFMNRSSEAVAAAGRFYRLELDDLLVISDDLALPLGRLRMRTGGSAGSHKGLKDVIRRLGSDGFARLRMGIGEAPYDAAAYVLAPFDEAEKPMVRQAVDQAVAAVECWVRHGSQETMNRYNGWGPV